MAINKLNFVNLYKQQGSKRSKASESGETQNEKQSNTSKNSSNLPTRTEDSIKATDDREDAQRGSVGTVNEELANKIKSSLMGSGVLHGHYKTVTAIDWEDSGARMITGGYDYKVKLWNFGGMDSRLQSFREIEAAEGYQINDLKFSLTGEMFLAATTSPQARLFDRNGIMLQEYKRGDMYLKDMRHTNGHVSSLTSCLWDPSDKNKFITAATDATIRVWDVESPLKQQEVVVVRGAGKSKGNRKLSVTAMGYPMEQDRGKYLVSGHDDGSISIWSTLTTNKVRADINIDHAHTYGSEITSVVVHRDGNRIYSRSNDSTIKLWDIRKLKNNGLGGGGCGAVSVVDGGVVSTYPQTSISLSPNGNKVLVATNDGVVPELVFFDSADLTELYRKRIEIDGNRSGEQYRETGANKSKVSLVKVFWHKKIEQLAVTNSLGNTQIFYNDNKNSNDTAVVKNKGIIQCINKKASTIKDSSKGSATDGGDYGVVGKIITPHALPMFKEESASVSQSARLRKMAKIRKNPVLSAKPEPPVNAGRQGKGGMIGTSETQYIMRSIMKDTSRDEDPRAALLKHAAEAEANPYFIAPAYQKNQPKPVFNEEPIDENVEPQLKRRK